MGIVVKAPFRKAGSRESKYRGIVDSIVVEDDSVILSVKGESGIYCDYHLAQSHGQDVHVGDSIEFFVLPMNFNNESVADEDFCFSIELARSIGIKSQQTEECSIITFPGTSTPLGPSKGPSHG